VPGLTKKALERALRQKLDEWIASIEDRDLQLKVHGDAFVAGGAIASLLLGEKPNDYDIYFKTKETALKVAEYYVERLKSSLPDDTKAQVFIHVTEKDGHPYIMIKSAGAVGENGYEGYRYFEYLPANKQHMAEDFLENAMNAAKDGPKYRPVFMTGHAVTLSDDIQLCIRFTGPIEEVVPQFDFAHSQLAYDYANNQLVVIDPRSLQCLLSKELYYTGSKYPLAALFRVRKFLERGFRINAGQLLKIAFDINQLNLQDMAVLEDQLIGVDIAYFCELLGELKKSSRPLDATYIAELVERIF